MKAFEPDFSGEILEKLEGEEKRLIVFRYFQDMTQTEVAKKWECPRFRFPGWKKGY